MSNLKKYLTTWWIPILTYIGLQIVHILGLKFASSFVFKLFPFLLVPVAVSIAISSLVILVKHKWYTAVGQLFVGLFIVIFFYVLNPRDAYFLSLKIPDNIEYKVPLDLKTQNSTDSIMTLSQKHGEFIIANYAQGGHYKIFIWVNPKEEGRIYLKAFEEKGNIPLSADRLRDKTETKVINDELKCYSSEFTIYEGAWENYYIARIEVWFNPINGDDYKLNDELYRVEGWIR